MPSQTDLYPKVPLTPAIMSSSPETITGDQVGENNTAAPPSIKGEVTWVAKQESGEQKKIWLKSKDNKNYEKVVAMVDRNWMMKDGEEAYFEIDHDYAAGFRAKRVAYHRKTGEQQEIWVCEY